MNENLNDKVNELFKLYTEIKNKQDYIQNQINEIQKQINDLQNSFNDFSYYHK